MGVICFDDFDVGIIEGILAQVPIVGQIVDRVVGLLFFHFELAEKSLSEHPV